MANLAMDGFDSEGSITATANYLRAVSLAIAFYDWLLTLPAEYRFYKSQRSWRLSPGCILFIAIRYTSIAVLLFSNVGYFGNFFDAHTCKRYFIVAPVFKVVQTVVSQIILGVRTMNISRRAPWVTYVVAVAFVLITIAEWFLNLWNRVPVQGTHHNCTAGNRPPVLTVWLFYVLAMSYDLITLGISTYFLLSFGSNAGKMVRLVRIMLTDGLVYFIALTGVNIFNLILYRSSDESVQSSGVSLGYTVTWIMSQRILIHLRDAAAAHNRTITTQVVVSRALPSAYSISHAMRSQFEKSDRDRDRERPHGLSTSLGFGTGTGTGTGSASVSGLRSRGADVDWSYTSSVAARRANAGMSDVDELEDVDEDADEDMDVAAERSFVSVALSRVASGSFSARGSGSGSKRHDGGSSKKKDSRGGKSSAAVRDAESSSSGEEEAEEEEGDLGVPRGGRKGHGHGTSHGRARGRRRSARHNRERDREPDLEARHGRSGGNTFDEYDEAEADAAEFDAAEWDGDRGRGAFDVDVRVQIEETVTVELDADAFARESYRAPRVLWSAASAGAAAAARAKARAGGRGRRRAHDGGG